MSRHAKERVRPARVVPVWWAVLGVLVIAVAAWAAVRGRTEDAATAETDSAAVHVVTTSMDINGEATLAPAPGGATPRLTAQQAWAKHAAPNRGPAVIPRGTTTYLGLFSQNSSAGRLSYVYRLPAHSCTTTASPAPTPPACREWLVLDANTGAEVAEEHEIEVSAH